VAELADALDLGSSAFGVGVRLPSPAPHADVAQLVEHNLAKVGVASSSLVVRSIYKKPYKAGVAELADAQDLKSCGR
jgi:hypothetical protein